MSARVNRDDIDKFHDYGIHLPTRTLSLDSPPADDGDDTGVTHAMAQRFIKNLRILEHASKEEITILFNTTGGDTYDGMAIYDAIKASPCRIKMVVHGQASSMGCIILQAADERLLSAHSHMMFHLGPSSISSGHVYENAEEAIFQRQFAEVIDDIVYECVRKKTKWSRRRFRELNIKGQYLTAQRAIELGLADAIVGQE